MFGLTEWLGRFSQLFSLPGQIDALGDCIMSKLNELAGQLAAVNEQLLKTKEEIISRIDALEEALSDEELPDAANDALAALRQTAQAMDDIIPDAAPAPIDETAPDPVE